MVALDPSAVPGTVLRLLQRLEQAGHEVFLVGGVVRDLLRGEAKAVADVDLTTRATPIQVIALFDRVIPTGLAHGTVTVLFEGETLELTTYRGEAEYSDGRHPDKVQFLDSVEDDLARRDFTVNAIAWNPLHDDLRDPFGGREDLQARILRAVGDPVRRFGEDGLRALRALRFMSTLEFEIEAQTAAAIPGALDTYQSVAVERILHELEKLLCGPGVVAAIQRLGEFGMGERIIKGAGPMLYTQREELARLPSRLGVRTAAWLHPLGDAGATAVLRKLRSPKATLKAVLALIRGWSELKQRLEAENPQRAVWRRRCLAIPDLDAEDLVALVEAYGYPEEARALQEEWARRPPLRVGDLALDGAWVMKRLGLDPGPEIGELLHWLLEWVLEDPSRNTAASLEAHLQDWKKTR